MYCQILVNFGSTNKVCFTEIHLKLSSAKCRQFFSDLNELTIYQYMRKVECLANWDLFTPHHSLNGRDNATCQSIPSLDWSSGWTGQACMNWGINLIIRDHFVNTPSQWETMLRCNIFSHWLGAYIKWSLLVVIFWGGISVCITRQPTHNHEHSAETRCILLYFSIFTLLFFQNLLKQYNPWKWSRFCFEMFCLDYINILVTLLALCGFSTTTEPGKPVIAKYPDFKLVMRLWKYEYYQNITKARKWRETGELMSHDHHASQITSNSIVCSTSFQVWGNIVIFSQSRLTTVQTINSENVKCWLYC